MGEFSSHAVTLQGRIRVSKRVEDAFVLFSPEGERLWVPGWDPEPLHPPHAAWEEGQIFRTREERGEAVWIVTRLDRVRHEVTYHRVEPGRYVARIEVRCRAAGERETEVSTAYTFLGLSEDGNEEIARMSREAYDAKMARWERWIRAYVDEEG